MNLEKMFNWIKFLTIFTLSFYSVAGVEQPKGLNMENIKVIIKNETYRVELEKNPTTQAFLERLPLEMEMRELNRNEKYGVISKGLPRGKGYSGDIEIGDLMLYGTDCIVLFYKNFNTPYSYTRLGKVIEKEKLKENIDERDKNLKVIFSK